MSKSREVACLKLLNRIQYKKGNLEVKVPENSEVETLLTYKGNTIVYILKDGSLLATTGSYVNAGIIKPLNVVLAWRSSKVVSRNKCLFLNDRPWDGGLIEVLIPVMGLKIKEISEEKLEILKEYERSTLPILKRSTVIP